MLIDVACAVAVNHRSLLRRSGAAIGQMPQACLQAVRLKAARASLEPGDMTVQSVAMQFRAQPCERLLETVHAWRWAQLKKAWITGQRIGVPGNMFF